MAPDHQIVVVTGEAEGADYGLAGHADLWPP
jgi:hypothetical protein